MKNRTRARNAIAHALLGLLLAAAGPAARGQETATSNYTIPGTVNASGLNGTRFVSDVAITNPGPSPVVAVLTLVPANGTGQSLMFLNPGQTVVTTNVLQSLWGANGAAATVVSASAPVLIRARTYNTAASGTYGVALPVVSDAAQLDQSAPGESLWVSQSADPNAGYRTNVAVVFPNPDGGAATVTVFDASGHTLGHQDFALGAAGFQQFSVGSFAGSVDVARAELVVTRGNATGYAVVVDNVTGDSSLFPFEALPAGRQDVLVNGVARANGRNATFFRTDARIFNPGAADANVTVYFHANQNANPSPQSATFAVPAGQVRDVVDVLQSLLGLPVGSAGALRFTSDAPVAIVCRTSNVDPTGGKPGTYGAQQKPVPVASFLMSADAGAVVTAIRQNGSFRTNVGFAAGADGASYSLALQNNSGVTVASTTASLGSWGWTQPNVQDLFPGTTVPDAATLLVTVTAGSVDVFDSSIDNASGDPVVTPIMSRPVSIPSTATIGAAGGSVQSDDGRLLLRIPAGALSSPTAITIQTTADVAPNATGPSYSVTPGDLTLSKPALVTFNYGPEDVSGSAPDLLIPVLLGDSGSWYGIPDWTVDTARQRLTAPLPLPVPGSVAARAGARTALAGKPKIINMATRVSLVGDDLVPPGHTATYAVHATKGASEYTSTWDVVSEDTNVETLTYTWAVDGDPGGSSVFGTVPADSGQSAVYTAPSCPPSSTGAVISASFMLNGVPKKATKAILIFPDSWILKINEEADETCLTNTSGSAAFHTSGQLTQPFTIRHKDRQVVPDSPTSTTPAVTNAGSCDIGHLCTITQSAAAPGLAISSVGGFVSWAGYLHPIFAYRHMGGPGFHVVCTNPPGTADISAKSGANEPRTDKGAVPWQGKDVTLPTHVANYTFTATFSVHPNPALNCP